MNLEGFKNVIIFDKKDESQNQSKSSGSRLVVYNKSEIQKSMHDTADIMKSHLGNMIGTDNLKISKKGKEIKEKLVSAMAQDETEKEEQYKQLIDMKSKIGVDPTEEVDDYTFQGLKSRIAVCPKVYAWDDCYTKHYPQNGMTLSDDQTSENDLCKLKSNYNYAVRKYIENCVDLLQLKTMIDNIDEKKTYDLTLKQATTLGF